MNNPLPALMDNPYPAWEEFLSGQKIEIIQAVRGHGYELPKMQEQGYRADWAGPILLLGLQHRV
jgi:hypothetical protein